MDVVELLPDQIGGIEIHVKVAPLPEAARECVFFGECENELRGVAAFLSAQQSRHPLFEDLHSLGGRGTWRFADEQMDVVGHEDVANQLELEAGANFAKDANRKIPVFH